MAIPIAHFIEYDESAAEFTNEQYEPYDLVNGEVPNNTQPTYN